MNLQGKAQIYCNNCNSTFSIDQSNFGDFNPTSVEERNMGSETTYEADLAVNCPSCGADITGNFVYVEYPPGGFNMEEFENIENAKILDSNLSAI
ncbi:hypothetical protein [Carnobacterium maltaromaticum]|uniref:hypothetical protein n=1 Tax=Carnobacterium maltaromaticum TaxID=2751 RepID=UPI00295EDBE8|nr:hypothetical protein [Carnobacterium maltaromaticum]